ncbi:GAF and ANTAR domain-containing protein [Amycolatopsis minnesotensis]|uniref:GAF and ANTAR domain-containing protein n=2 Tax=Amycolatopsis minnesotensis TaxID=337894 RepID=A0ABN2Q0S1_9PSEU
METFVELADTLTDDFDAIDFLHVLTDRCVELLDVDAAGLLLASSRGELQLVASSNESARVLEVFQLQANEGPCLEAFHGKKAVSWPDLSSAGTRWPQFARKAWSVGFRSVVALPMQLRSEVIGVLNLFRSSTGNLGPEELRSAKAMVDVATISLLQARSIRHHELLVEQLETALTSRVIIEQAKGFVAERLGVEMGEAFALLRRFARNNRRSLSDVSSAVVTRAPDVEDLYTTGETGPRTKG